MSAAVDLDWVISADDHVLEPGDVWQPRVPARLRDAAPRLEHEADGAYWYFEGDRVLVSVGRRPYTAGLGLEQAGVKTDAKSGRVEVDGHFQTSVPGVYAIGDIIAGPMLAHKASEEGIAVAEYLAGQKPHVNYNAIPSVIYTAPELASVGLTEEQVEHLDTHGYKDGSGSSAP